MKKRLVPFAALVCLTSCSLFSGPTATARKFMDQAKSGDAEAMTGLFSRRAIQRDGIEKTNTNNETFAKLMQEATSRKSYEMNNIKESTSGNNARVAFHYQAADRTDSIRLVFALSKEGGTWKIDNIGGSELEAIADLASPELKDPPIKKAPATEVPNLGSPPEMVPPKLGSVLDTVSPNVTSPADEPPPPPAPTPADSPIAGGVLNEKALTLPQPPYPPIAKAAHAGGKVVVQVIVDENGNVIRAEPIVGHPLLRAVAANAARGAKFPPEKKAGVPVKVKGVIHYRFEAQ